MASATGFSTIDFGAFPGTNEAVVNVTSQAAISDTSKAEAYIMGDDSTGDHTANDHRWLTAFVGLSCGTPTAATGFPIYARSGERLQGTYKIQWVWSD